MAGRRSRASGKGCGSSSAPARVVLTTGRVPAGCGSRFGTSPAPAARGQAVSHPLLKRVVKTSASPVGLLLRTRSSLNTTLINRPLCHTIHGCGHSGTRNLSTCLRGETLSVPARLSNLPHSALPRARAILERWVNAGGEHRATVSPPLRTEVLQYRTEDTPAIIIVPLSAIDTMLHRACLHLIIASISP